MSVDGFCHAHPGHIVPATYATPAKPCSGLHELWVELNNDGETPSGMLLNAQLTCK